MSCALANKVEVKSSYMVQVLRLGLVSRLSSVMPAIGSAIPGVCKNDVNITRKPLPRLL